MLENEFIQKLSEAERILTEQIIQNINANNIPREIADHLVADPPVQEGKGRFSATIRIIMAKDTPAQAAAAYEYGSGVHATRGTAGRYPIEARNVNFLKFMFPEAQNIHPENPNAPYQRAPGLQFDAAGNVYMKKVMHPGVAPRPYVHPAIEDKRKEIRDLFKAALKLEISTIIREANATQ